MQGPELAEGDALGILVRTHIHPGPTLRTVRTLIVMDCLTVFHEDRPEGEDIHDFLSVHGIGIRQIFLGGGMDAVEITVFIHDQEIHTLFAGGIEL